MSYDIFFLRRDPGQSFEDALEDIESSYVGGDPGPLTEEDLELWDAILPAAREILGSTAELTQDDEETRELTDPVTGIGLTFFQGELEIHVPENRVGGDDVALMQTVYDLARAVERATGLEGYDPQLGEPVSDASESSPTRRRWADDLPDEDDEDDGRVGAGSRSVPGPRTLRREPFAPERADGRPRRWWEFWKS